MATNKPEKGAVKAAPNEYQTAQDAEWRETRDKQVAAASEIAAKLDRGEELSPMDRMFAAGIVRLWAETMPTQRKKKKGAQPTFNRVEAVQLMILYCEHRKGPKMTQRQAAEKLTGVFGVDEEALLKAFHEKADAVRKGMAWMM